MEPDMSQQECRRRFSTQRQAGAGGLRLGPANDYVAEMVDAGRNDETACGERPPGVATLKRVVLPDTGCRTLLMDVGSRPAVVNRFLFVDASHRRKRMNRPMKRKPLRSGAPEIPPAVYQIALRRTAEGRRAALAVPDLTIELLMVGMYLQGVEDMGNAVAKRFPRLGFDVPEFEVW